jgi:predicted permease
MTHFSMTNFSTDIAHAWRALLARPLFLATAVVTLTLGIGMVAAIFTVYDAVLLKPLPFTDAARTVTVLRDEPPVSSSPVSAPVFREWQERSGAAFAAFGASVPMTLNLTGAGDAYRLDGYAVTPGFWNVFGQPLQLGRAFGADEENRNEHVVVISDGLWRDRFGAAADIIGRDIALNGESWRVIGVADPAFRYPDDAQVWLPTFLPANTDGRGSNMLSVVARLREGVSMRQAATVMDGITRWQASTFADSAGLSARIVPLHQRMTSGVREPLRLLLAAAGLVLLIACANLANLMLARGQGRARELGVRRALGASRVRLLRQVLAESLVVAILGALAALLVAQPAIDALLAFAPDLVPGFAHPVVDLRVVAATTALSLATLLLFGLVPAWRAANADPMHAMQGNTRGDIGGRGQLRARAVLVSAEIALAMTLLAGAGLLIDSLRRLAEVDSGVDTSQVLTARFSLPTPVKEPGEDFAAWYARVRAAGEPRIEAIGARLRRLPGVESVAIGNALPASGQTNWNGGFTMPGHAIDERALVEFRFVGPQYLQTFGIPLVAGRAFNATDGSHALFATEALVNQAFVDRYLGGGNAVGEQIEVFDGSAKTIVGVIGNVHQAGPAREVPAEVYFPVRSGPGGDLALALKVRGDAMAFAEPLRRAMREVAADAPLFEVRPLVEVTREPTRLRRFNMVLMNVFAGVALALAAIGLYGVLAYATARRQREIGLRQALGARRGDIGRLVLGAGLRMLLPGIALGLLGALALGRVIASQLYGVGGADPLVLGAVVAVLSLVALAACALPTVRATRVAPIEALRDE